MVEAIIVLVLVILSASLSYARGYYVGTITGEAKAKVVSEMTIELFKEINNICNDVDKPMTEEQFMKMLNARMDNKIEQILDKHYPE